MAITTDPVADLLTRIRNANSANHDTLQLASSKLKVRITEILKDEGFIQDFEVIPHAKQNQLKITLRYGARKDKAITNLKRISKPGLRVYAGHDKLPRVLRGLGTAILTTSQGVMTEREARRRGIGGEILCHVW